MAKTPLKELPKIYHPIANEWPVEFIGNLCRVKTGSSDTQDKVSDGQYPFYVRAEEVQRSDKYIFDGLGILTAGDGVGVGKVFHMVEGKIDFHQRVYLLHDFSQRINPKYLFEFFKLNFIRQVFRFTAKTSVDSVRMDMISKMSIPLPPINEQRKIAEILSTWDKSIEATERLLENSKKRKKALMQQLLTGKKRLPGFSQTWSDFTIGDLCFVDKDSLKADTGPTYSFRYISLSNVSSGKINQNLSVATFATAPSRARMKVKEGDILLATVRPNLQGFAIVGKEHEDCVASTGFAVLQPKTEGDTEFVFACLFSKMVTDQIEALVTGSNYPAISSSDVKKLKIKAPSHSERKKIGQIFKMADCEIAALSSRLVKLSLEKTALMQQLLTGKKRVTVETETP